MNEQLYEGQADFADEMISYVKSKCRMNIIRWKPTKNDYPSYMLLGPDKGILAYINFNISNCQDDICFRHEYNTLLSRLRLAISDLDRPVFNIYQAEESKNKIVYFETYEQILDILLSNPNRVKKDRTGREYFCSKKIEMGYVEELLTIQDKTREVVYADLTSDVPLLLNYFYINNDFKHSFHSPYFDNIGHYATVSDMFNDIRNKMINKDKNILSSYPKVEYDFNQRVILLDSGASSIVKLIAKEVDYDIDKFCEKLFEIMSKYYDFADRYKFDMVVGFDLGGKYTFKAGETQDRKLIAFYNNIDEDKINIMLLEKTVEYLLLNKNYYPKVLATVHGQTPEKYREYTKEILRIEKEKQFVFWGFALGGVASSRGMDSSWYEGIDFSGTNMRNMKGAVISAKAIQIVHSMAGERPIHALGCGGFINIPMNYYFGATSFDAASPARRAGDGNDLSVEYLYSKSKPNKAQFSKMLLGGYNVELEKMQGDFCYYRICDVEDDYELCGCSACRYIKHMYRLKKLYAKKKEDVEAHYCARQIMNTHSINSHTILCKVVSQYESMEEYVVANPSILNESLKKIYEQLKQL